MVSKAGVRVFVLTGVWKCDILHSHILGMQGEKKGVASSRDKVSSLRFLGHFSKAKIK